jgi:diguanylate cyclase (GGDEF)-like protein
LVRFLERHTSPAIAAAIYDAAGEPRRGDELMGDDAWSSYAQVRALLEAAAPALGGRQALARAGREVDVLDGVGAEYLEILQGLGSPDALYEQFGAATNDVTTMVSVRSVSVGPNEWILHQRFADGFAPFREYCAYSLGTMAITPRLFGYPPAEVEEEACQCDGAPECCFRVRWTATDDLVRRARHFETRAKLLATRLETLQRTVEQVVSADVAEALPQIVAAAAKSVRAPSHIMVLETAPLGAERVYALGLDAAEITSLVQDLASATITSHTHLVVDIVSARQRYGYLAAIDPTGNGFWPHERDALESYARVAAAALDAATALDESRRQGETARALLGLSGALSEIATSDDIAERLAAAVPEVIDCDRAVVVLYDAATKVGYIGGTFGYPAETMARLRTLRFERPAMDELVRIERSDDETSDPIRAIMCDTGSVASANVPIIADGEMVGVIAATVTESPDRLLMNPELDERLRGLAAQASIAVRNARLVDTIRHQALHDGLTGLPNRTLILDRVDHMLARARRSRHATAVMFIDLDRFKDVNDTLGHAVGDELLKAVAERLSRMMRDSDTVGRLGGDEFVVLVEGVALDAGPAPVAERLLELLGRPFHLNGPARAPITVSASIGIAVGDRVSASEALRDADVALYQAKAAGKHRYTIFEPAMGTAVQNRVQLETDLRAALERNQFFLVYQPIFDLRTAAVTGVEALLRWRHPVRGVLLPDVFVPILEDNGSIVEVGRWVLNQSCRAARAWMIDGHSLSLSVNVSVRQLEVKRFMDDLEQALSSSGLDPTALIIEITETAIMRDPEANVARLQAVKALGVRIAIDDFGTGYSSLAYLRQFPVDALKIDRSFVAAIAESPEAIAFVHTLVQLGKTLGLATLAEGIEETHQLGSLQRQDCDSGQGFLLARPLEVGAVAAFLRAQEQVLPADRARELAT